MKTLKLNQMEVLQGGEGQPLGCVAGLLVIGGSLLSGFNPLGIIAGAMMVDRYC